MSETMSCSELARDCKEQRDTANSLSSKLFRERQNVSRQEERVRELERELRLLEAQLQTFLGAGRVFGPGGGAVVMALSKLTLEIKIGRVKEELGPARSDLARMESRLAKMEHDHMNFDHGAKELLRRIDENGCPRP